MQAKVITSHCWNGDRTKIAIVPNNNIVEIYKVDGFDPKDWKLETRFRPEHAQLITCIDWAPKTNRILTCSQDRNAYVWSPPTDPSGEWTPEIVLLRFERAATCCCWCPSETKFAVGGSQKHISCCFYDEGNDFWVSKRLTRHASAVMSLAWHPSSMMLASSGCDFKSFVHSALLESAGDKRKAMLDHFGQVKGCNHGTTIHTETTTGSWVSLVFWSPDGLRLAMCPRNSTLQVLHFDASAPEEVKPKKYVVLLKSLPFTCGVFVDSDHIVAAGYDAQPSLLAFNKEKDNWEFERFLVAEEASLGKASEAPKSGALAAMARFQAKTMTGQTDASSSSSSSSDKPVDGHTNATTALKIAKTSPDGRVTHISSSGLDGKLLIWKVE
ncbi:actin related protein 2/3 complex subunit 1 [Monocercomonoides exilis]|uniref:actin related protein 2/3 complex subunit 1 n=1 Tax=Monocercomonoides exilis TaxID=2049356 RepID=UPI003559F9B9|nr:actin related protein 2/3 complex subunit 1 [Monocercomonoides exilis]|eukprot:MONOS_11291.1-p1 / transcript=MONOS_11291.1 / gene=MONOS_11291 / organism=Monocercomonoides_exilis_PA203 / gene_product=actin related protein 2/3 complex subunit 1 / transcript_product=actin related protein 2/3 complex subunit 1 / location=Mono_scaffold00559:16332-17620(+) / protein_length=383 / sequence_SO=supercontig / SO=protein_coding / is_pseudo=false